MEIDAEKLMSQAIKSALIGGAKKLGTGYNSPLDGILSDSLTKYTPQLRDILDNAIKSCIQSNEFKEEIAQSTRTSLAKNLVKKFGGEIEKQVNALKSDPTTRARIVIAIEEIIKEKTGV